MTKYGTVPFQDILIATNRQYSTLVKLKHGLAKSNFGTKYIYVSALKSWNSN